MGDFVVRHGRHGRRPCLAEAGGDGEPPADVGPLVGCGVNHLHDRMHR